MAGEVIGQAGWSTTVVNPVVKVVVLLLISLRYILAPADFQVSASSVRHPTSRYLRMHVAAADGIPVSASSIASYPRRAIPSPKHLPTTQEEEDPTFQASEKAKVDDFLETSRHWKGVSRQHVKSKVVTSRSLRNNPTDPGTYTPPISNRPPGQVG